MDVVLSFFCQLEPKLNMTMFDSCVIMVSLLISSSPPISFLNKFFLMWWIETNCLDYRCKTWPVRGCSSAAGCWCQHSSSYYLGSWPALVSNLLNEETWTHAGLKNMFFCCLCYWEIKALYLFPFVSNFIFILFLFLFQFACNVLIIATRRGHADIVRLFLKAGANVDVIDMVNMFTCINGIKYLVTNDDTTRWNQHIQEIEITLVWMSFMNVESVPLLCFHSIMV